MALAINTQSNAFGVVNMAKGSIVTDAVAAVAQTFTLGFNPRKITIINLTDRISDEWDEGMDLNAIYVNILGITAKLDADAGVTDTNYGALWGTVPVYMSLHTVANGTTTLEVTNGINVVGNTFSLTAATMVASKQFYWTAQG
jgi:hypothetical protein